MMSFFSNVIADTAFAEVGLRNQVQFLQQLESPIDSRYVGIRVTTVQLLIDFLGADVLIGIMKCLDNQHALGC